MMCARLVHTDEEHGGGWNGWSEASDGPAASPEAYVHVWGVAVGICMCAERGDQERDI